MNTNAKSLIPTGEEFPSDQNQNEAGLIQGIGPVGPTLRSLEFQGRGQPRQDRGQLEWGAGSGPPKGLGPRQTESPRGRALFFQSRRTPKYFQPC
jgi:hypothetical protein